MKLYQVSPKKRVLVNFGVIIGIVFVAPLLLDLIEINSRILLISYLGTSLIVFLVVLMLIDIYFLIFQKQNNYMLSLLNMSITLLLFLLMMYSFLNNIFDIVYVMNYSNSALPLIYKIVFIWAGEQGSIMTWMVFNSIIIYFYRIKKQKKEDLIFMRSILISLLVSIVFLIIMLSLNPFEIDSPPAFVNGNPNLDPSLYPILMSPFMIWHPFFTFIAYAIFLIPFTITIAEIITRNSKLLDSYEKDFYYFSIKFGWLVLTLSIGLGAYWGKIASNWGRYWGWDPVETVSLVPWLFSTAFFHTIIFKKKNPNLIKINVGIIFLSIIYSTLITRGGISPIHSFTGGTELVMWTALIGFILTCFSLYVIYIVLEYLMEDYRKKKLLFDYLSYLFLFGLSFVCIFGLFITPLTSFLSIYFPLDVIYIEPDFFILTTLIFAIGLAISLIFCSLWEYFELKYIGLVIILGISVQSVLSFLMLFISGMWINPIIVIYFFSIFSSSYKFIRNFTMRKGIAYFFRMNSKTIIHSGISFILVGSIIPSIFEIFQDVFFITGFILLLVGMIPSILRSFFPKKNHEKN